MHWRMTYIRINFVFNIKWIKAARENYSFIIIYNLTQKNQVARENYQLRLRIYFLEVFNFSLKLIPFFRNISLPTLNTNLADVINLYDDMMVTQERLNQGEANNSYDEQIVNLRAELAASR